MLHLQSFFPLNSERIAALSLQISRSSFAFRPAAAAIRPTATLESLIGPVFRSAAYLPPSAVSIAPNGPLNEPNNQMQNGQYNIVHTHM